MKRNIIFLLLLINYCYGMNTMPGLLNHPYWRPADYDYYAKVCFEPLKQFDRKRQLAAKDFIQSRIELWEAIFTCKEPIYIHRGKIILQDDLLQKGLEIFCIDWDNPPPLTKGGECQNAEILRLFFKKFTISTIKLFVVAQTTIIKKIDPAYEWEGPESNVILKFYPTKNDNFRSIIKEGTELAKALLKCFETS